MIEETLAYQESLGDVADKVEAIRKLPPEGLPKSLMFFRTLFEFSDKGRVIDPHLAATLGTGTTITFDDFLKGYFKFKSAVETVYDDLVVKGNVKVLHSPPRLRPNVWRLSCGNGTVEFVLSVLCRANIYD